MTFINICRHFKNAGGITFDNVNNHLIKIIIRDEMYADLRKEGVYYQLSTSLLNHWMGKYTVTRKA
jgi:hypothetical protein